MLAKYVKCLTENKAFYLQYIVYRRALFRAVFEKESFSIRKKYVTVKNSF